MIDVAKTKNWQRRALWCFAFAVGRMGNLLPMLLIRTRSAWATSCPSYAFSILLFAAGMAVAGDWPGWRGPLTNGVSYESGLPDAADEILWRIPYGGRSTPVISNGRIYAINLAGQGVMEQERVLFVDLQTGRPLWGAPVQRVSHGHSELARRMGQSGCRS